MVAREEAARLLLAQAAALKDAGKPNTVETGQAKWQCAEAGLANAVAALDIWQSQATGENPTLLRHWANAKGAVIYGGTVRDSPDDASRLRPRRPGRTPDPPAGPERGRSGEVEAASQPTLNTASVPLYAGRLRDPT